MSRIGNKAITVPDGVEVVRDGQTITVKSSKGTLSMKLLKQVDTKLDGKILTITRESDEYKAIHGLTRALIANMITGVTEGYSKRLEINGVGYRAAKQGKKLVLTLGYSHPVEFEETEHISFDVPDQNTIIVKGIDKQRVGQVAAMIREKRLPEPYKGKGIKYSSEHIRRKEGKAGSKK